MTFQYHQQRRDGSSHRLSDLGSLSELSSIHNPSDFKHHRTLKDLSVLKGRPESRKHTTFPRIVGAGVPALVAAGAAAWGASKAKAYRRVLPELRTKRLFFPVSGSNAFFTWLIDSLWAGATGLPEGVQMTQAAVPVDAALAEPFLASFMLDAAFPHSVAVREYHALGGSGARGILVWIHGGGLVTGSAYNKDAYCGQLALDTQCEVLSIQYRLAPQYPFPAPFFDVALACLYAWQKAEEAHVPLVISGGSAGGCLASAACQYLTDAGIPVAAQILAYPMLDCETGTQPTPGYGDFVWSRRANQYGWKSYLRNIDAVTDPRLASYAVPAHRVDMSSLPPAWIGVGNMDLFYRESKAYADRLQAAGVDVEFVEVDGMYHAADGFAPTSASMTAFYNSQLAAIARAVG
ncbi:MAG: alpha/beta hydrolase [Actinomycetaceae bacterium]|nr:alpha/beta hydrolase [Actinomycetaceae bacterium]MDY6082547.1 alpha/beta hydrolase [Actinomycetaceae bacterium]